MYITATDSIGKIIAYLNYQGVFPKKECEKNIKNIIFSDKISHIGGIEEQENEKDYMLSFNEAKLLLKKTGNLKIRFNSTADLKLLKKSFKHVLIYKILNSNYFGHEDIKIISNLIFQNDKEAREFVGETNEFIPRFSQSIPNLKIMGYTRLAYNWLSVEDRERIFQSIQNYSNELYVFYHENPERINSIESFSDSFHRLFNDMFSTKDLFSLYSSSVSELFYKYNKN